MLVVCCCAGDWFLFGENVEVSFQICHPLCNGGMWWLFLPYPLPVVLSFSSCWIFSCYISTLQLNATVDGFFWRYEACASLLCFFSLAASIVNHCLAVSRASVMDILLYVFSSQDLFLMVTPLSKGVICRLPDIVAAKHMGLYELKCMVVVIAVLIYSSFSSCGNMFSH